MSIARAACKASWQPRSLSALLSEHRQQPVAQELVDPAVVLVDRSARRGEELVQDEHHVVRQPVP